MYYKDSKRGKIGKGRKFDRVQQVVMRDKHGQPVFDRFGRVRYKFIFHRTDAMR